MDARNVEFNPSEETETFSCSICEGTFIGFGNNPDPFPGEWCCSDCNQSFVVPARMCPTKLNRRDFNVLLAFARAGRSFRRQCHEIPVLEQAI
jgi:hypothetical protein